MPSDIESFRTIWCPLFEPQEKPRCVVSKIGFQLVHHHMLQRRDLCSGIRGARIGGADQRCLRRIGASHDLIGAGQPLPSGGI